MLKFLLYQMKGIVVKLWLFSIFVLMIMSLFANQSSFNYVNNLLNSYLAPARTDYENKENETVFDDTKLNTVEAWGSQIKKDYLDTANNNSMTISDNKRFNFMCIF